MGIFDWLFGGKKNIENDNGYNETYHSNGKKTFYKKNGVLEGLCSFYDKNGKLSSTLMKKNGETEGVFKSFYENGQIREEKTYVEGTAQGTKKGYYNDGVLSIEGILKDGRMNGLWKFYYFTGELFKKINYENGKKEGYEMEFKKNGELISKTNYKNNFKVDDSYINETLKQKDKTENNLINESLQKLFASSYEESLIERHKDNKFLENILSKLLDKYFESESEKRFKDWCEENLTDYALTEVEIKKLALMIKSTNFAGSAKEIKTTIGKFKSEFRKLSPSDIEQLNKETDVLNKERIKYENYTKGSYCSDEDDKYYTSEDKPFNGLVKYYMDEVLYEETNWKDGFKHGTLKKYYDNGQLSDEENYKDGIENGVFRCFEENGNLVYEFEYKNGEFDGLRKDFIDGKIYTEEYYKNGKLDGLRRTYDEESGKLIKEENYKNDIEEGLVKSWHRKTYYKNGKISNEEGLEKVGVMRNGLKTGLWKSYYSYDTGGIELEANYLDDKYDGSVIYYNIKGEIIKEAIYKKHNLIKENIIKKDTDKQDEINYLEKNYPEEKDYIELLLRFKGYEDDKKD